MNWDKINKTIEEIIKMQKEFQQEMRLLQESQKDTDRRFKETDKKFKETDEKFKETDEKFKETDEKFKETDKKFKETDEKFKETDKKFKETNEILKDLTERLKETDRLIKELSKNVGGLNNAIGKIPEAISIPKIEESFLLFGINIRRVYPNPEIKEDGKIIKEVDIIMPASYNNKNVVIVVETQLQYRKKQEIDEFEKFVKEDFKNIFNEYKDFGVIGCVCALSYAYKLEEYAENKGLFVMKPIEKLVGIVNRKDFKPTIF